MLARYSTSRIVFILVMLINVLIVNGLFSDTDVLKKVGFFWDVWGYPRNMAIDGNFVYISLGESDEGIQIVDISDPISPKRAGGLPYGWIYHVEAKDDVAFCGPRGESNIIVYDTKNKSEPKKITTLPTKAGASCKVFGNFLVIWSGESTIIYDITNSREPKLISTFEGMYIRQILENRAWFSNGQWVDLKKLSELKINGSPVKEGNLLAVVGKYLYFDRGKDGIFIYHQDNMDSVVTSFKPYGNIPKEYSRYYSYSGFQVIGNKAYFVNGSYGFAPNLPNELTNCAGLWVLDVSNPVNPQVIGRWGVEYARQKQAPLKMDGFRVRGNYAYIVNNLFGMHILDISNPAAITKIADYKCGGEISTIRVSGKRAYFSEYLSGGITILDISTPSLPKKIGYLYTGGSVYIFGVYKDSYLYFDYSDPEEPPINPARIGFGVADIRDPANPVIVYRENAEIGVCNVFDDYLIAAGGLYSLQDPIKPQKLSTLAGGGSYLKNGNYIYYALHRTPSQPNNCKIFDITNPSSPKLISQLTIAGDDSMISRDMKLVGDKLYIGSSAAPTAVNITEIDISNPSSPKIVGEYKNLGSGGEAHYTFHISGQYLFTFNYFEGSSNGAVYDISQGIVNAKIIQQVPGFYSWDSAMSGNFIYVSRLNGLEVFER